MTVACSLPCGPRLSGNREYKWKLVRPSEERIAHLTTQLNWRLNESANGEAFYLLGTAAYHTGSVQYVENALP
eukprot:4621-Eustigmatos_ZCMA.PRE.1